MKKVIIALVLIVAAALSAKGMKLQTNKCEIYQCEPPTSGFVTTGSALESFTSTDILNLDFKQKKMHWKDRKGNSTVDMYDVYTEGSTTTFKTKYNYVRATKDGSIWHVDIIYRDGQTWYMLKYRCTEKSGII